MESPVIWYAWSPWCSTTSTQHNSLQPSRLWRVWSQHHHSVRGPYITTTSCYWGLLQRYLNGSVPVIVTRTPHTLQRWRLTYFHISCPALMGIWKIFNRCIKRMIHMQCTLHPQHFIHIYIYVYVCMCMRACVRALCNLPVIIVDFFCLFENLHISYAPEELLGVPILLKELKIRL